MRDAVLCDLSALIEQYEYLIELLVTHDDRLPAPVPAIEAIAISQYDDVWQVWQSAIERADAVWLIAPETGGMLAKLTQMVSKQHKKLLGCSLEAVLIASSKHTTFAALSNRKIRCVPTYTWTEWTSLTTLHDKTFMQPSWVAKPDDGAGCEDSALFEDAVALATWLSHGRLSSHIIQPYQPGIAASLSMLCRNGQAWLLSCNQQKVVLEHGHFTYKGSVLNGMAAYWPAFERIAQQIAVAIPGLCGYIGVDVIVDTPNNDRIQVLEINPRLTTSYVGLHRALAYNPAKLVLDLFYNDDFKFPAEIARHVVEVNVDA